MDTLLIRTNQKTINKKVKSIAKANIHNIAKVAKRYVAGCGYVVYFYNSFGIHIGNICKENGQMTIRVQY